MSILKYKYKAHKLINSLFYIVVFVIGFILGFGAEKIDFNKLLSQVLMIDNAKAYTIGTLKNQTLDEEFIYNQFTNNFEDFDFIKYHNVWCSYSSSYSLSCYAMTDETYSNINFTVSGSTINYNAGTNGAHLDLYRFEFYKSTSMKTEYKYYDRYAEGNFTYKGSCTTNCYFNGYPNNLTENTTFSNRVLLDFSEYQIPDMVYNENLFKDNSDFKQICVTPDTRFAITSNNITYNDDETELKYFNGIDFIWFSYVPDGLTTYLYSSAEETKKTPLTEDGPLFNGINPGKWYYLDEKEEIDKFFNTDSSKGEIYPGVTLELEGYTDKYSHFGWYFHPFVVHFDNTQDGNNFFNVFHFKDKLNFYSILENGLDYYEELENARNGNICFYIKNTYDITILNKDIFDDDIGESTILGGDKFDINTTENSSSLNSKGLFSKINLFINNIKDTILFINGYIYELYVSLPNIVQLFIVAVFGLIVVRILVGMVTK